MSNQGLLNKLEQISFKFDEIGKQMVDPDIISDMKRYVGLNREYKELSEIVKVYHSYKDILANIEIGVVEIVGFVPAERFEFFPFDNYGMEPG